MPIQTWWARTFRAAAAALLLGGTAGRAESPGLPLLENISPKTYGADAQNWAVIQDLRGIVYAGNNQGVLAYDGTGWRLIRTPNRTTVRSLAEDGEGRIFVGATGELGRLVPDGSGRMAFESLAGSLPTEDRVFSDVWTTRATSRGILFQSREQLMLYKGGRFQVWKAATSFHVAFVVGDRIFVRQRQVGLEELVDGQLRLVPGGERFAAESVFTMLPMAGGILVGSRNQGLWRLGDAGLEPWPTEADGLLKRAALYAGAVLQDGTFALATIQGGVVLLGPDGHLKGTWDATTGLLGDNVKAVYPDGHGAVWLALDNGLARVEWPSPFSTLDERVGLRGSVWSLLRHGGRLYVATGQGTYALEEGPGGRPSFSPIQNAQTQSLALLEMDDRLLLANARGVFEIQGDTAVPVRPSSEVAISFARSRKDPSRVFVGLQGGLASLRWSGGRWLDEGLIPGVSDDIYSLAEDGEGRLWMGTGAQGVLRATFPAGWSGGAASPPPRVDRFGTAQGLASPNQVQVFLEGDQVRFATHGGLLRFDADAGLFAPDPAAKGLFPDGTRWIRTVGVGASGRLWLDTVDETSGLHEAGLAVPGPEGGLRWEPTLLRRLSDMEVDAIYEEPGGAVCFGGPEGVFRYDPAIPRSPVPPFQVLIRSIALRSGRLLPPTGRSAALPFSENALRFTFAAPGLDQSGSTRYSVLLEGYEGTWSPWSQETRKEYTNLHEGDYRFRVRAMDVYGREAPEAVFPFRVRPPWYRTWWAWVLWALGAATGIAAVIRARTRLLKERNERLESRIAEATEELREREQLLAHQATDLAQANRELKALNDQKDQYLGLVVHDLRNPLSGILMNAGTIEESSADPQIQSLAQQVVRQAQDMSGLIGRFLDIAAIDAGTVQPRLEAFPLELLLSEGSAAAAPLAARKGILLRTELPPGSAPALVDLAFAREILSNLLSNALKFSPSGTAVVLRLEESGGEVVLSVEDQGPGLTGEDKRRLFGRFARLSAQPTGGEPSVGLGLSIVKHMVEACGGRIWVDSDEGKGAAFRVAFRKAEP